MVYPNIIRREGQQRDATEELERLREENRRLAVSLGAFSAFVASRGLLEEAWHFVNEVYQRDEEEAA